MPTNLGAFKSFFDLSFLTKYDFRIDADYSAFLSFLDYSAIHQINRRNELWRLWPSSSSGFRCLFPDTVCLKDCCFILIKIIRSKERDMAIRSCFSSPEKLVCLFLSSFTNNKRYYDFVSRIKGNPDPGISKLISKSIEVI